jgi:hypothetical protein
MNKYYLLTFNEDWADEHDVPALECMTEEEYSEWLETPSGELNPNYIEEKENWDEYQRARKAYYQGLKDRDNLDRKSPNDYTNEDKAWIKANKVEYKSFEEIPKKVNSNMQAYLGNGGDGFEEDYSDKYLMKEFVEDNTVKVLEVTEEFYNTFKKANLSSFSLCNVFEIKNE